MKRLFQIWGTVGGALALLALYPLFHLFNLVASQVAWPRALGLAAVFAALLTALALGLAGVALALKLEAERWQRGWRWGFYALALANLALVGLKVFYVNPRLAPNGALFGVAIAVGVMVLAFWRYGDTEQRFVTRLLTGLGGLMLAVPLLATPAVVWAALHDTPRLVGAPPPPAPAAPKAGAPERIILVTFDALRARSTSMIDPERALTPAMAAMAAESTFYSRFYASSDRTLAAVPAILTGLGPELVVPQLKNRSGFGREGSVTSLAGHLASAGYRSYFATMLVNPLIFGVLGEFEHGFTTTGLFYENRFNSASFLPLEEAFTWLGERVSGKWSDMSPSTNEVVATRETFDAARRLLQASPERTFLWVHLGAPHSPYYDVDPADFDGRLQPRRYKRVDQNTMMHATPEELVRYEGIYERYVRFTDHEFGRFRDGLKADGLWDDSLVVLTADHGEEFTHGQVLHGRGDLTEDVCHIPLLMHRPGQTEGQTDDRVAGHLDVVPTVLAQALPDVPAGLPGRSLLLPEDPDRAAFTWSRFYRYLEDERGRDTAGIYHGGFKYLQGENGGHLYDLNQDPRGLRDVAERHPERLAALRARLEARFGR